MVYKYKILIKNEEEQKNNRSDGNGDASVYNMVSV